MDMVVGQWLCWPRAATATGPRHASRSEMDNRGGEELLLDVRPTRLGAGDQLAVVGDEDRLRGRVSVEIGHNSVVRASGIN